jgi:2-polyprenyl-6-methoxyphenol hydroxylase-like FAD-dependent oxidoreductase
MRRGQAVIVGGGIGGLSAAIALKRADLEVHVLERSPQLMEVGAGIQVWFNGMIGAERLGVADRIRAAGLEMQGQIYASEHGAPLVEIPLGRIADRIGVPRPVSIGRPELLGVLADTLDPGEIRSGAECTGFEQDEGGVTVRIGESGEDRCDVLVVADGLDSSLRAAVTPARRVYAGYQYLRALTYYDDPRLPTDALLVMVGRGTRFGTIPIGAARRTVFGSFVAGEGDGLEQGAKAEFAARFAAFAPPAAELIDSIPDDSAITHTDIADIDPLARWSDGRVVLIGDAAHATTPNQGRGASEAMQDAVALADHLGAVDKDDAAEVAGALQRFADDRRGPTARVQGQSRRIGKMIALRNPIACAMRNQAFRLGLGRRMATAIEREFGS